MTSNSIGIKAQIKRRRLEATCPRMLLAGKLLCVISI